MSLFKFILGIHVMNGGVALIIAPLAMVTVKGGSWHRRWGKIYFWAMAGVALTAACMCWLRSGLFLFLIAIFSFYLAFTGYRVLWRKRPDDRPHLVDWCAATAMLLAGAGLSFLGASGDKDWVRIIFGVIALLLGTLDVVRFIRPPRDQKAWMFAHMTRFLGAYIATVTAFSVVNFYFLPHFWRWLWPTVLGVPVITIWRIYLDKRARKENRGVIQ